MSINAGAKRGLRYRRISVQVFADEKFLKLSAPKPSGQGLWLYLLTGPFSTLIPGIIIGGAAGMAEALGWRLAAFRHCFQEIADSGMARADWAARLVFLPNALRHNPPQNPSVVTGWRQAWAEVPACELKQDAAAHIHQMLSSHGDAYATAFATFALSIGHDGPQGGPQVVLQHVEQHVTQAGPHQEQEQEQEQDALREKTPVERPRARSGAGNRSGVGAGSFPGDHVDHLACGPVCFTPRMTAKFIGRFGHDPQRLGEWARLVCEQESKRVDALEQPAHGDDFAYWTAAYDAAFPPSKPTAVPPRNVPDAHSTEGYLADLRAGRASRG